MIFDSGASRVTLDRSGWVRTVVHRSRPEDSYLAGAAIGSVVVDDQRLDVPVPQVLADVDEVEFVHTYPGRFRLVVRHTFAAGWGLRLMFSSLTSEPQQVERVELRLEPDPASVAYALTLGVTGAYSVAPADGRGPVLGGLLRRGSVDHASETGLELSPFLLRPDSRFILALQWDWYATPRAFGQERYGEAPSALFLGTGESAQVRVDPDVAVVIPAGLGSLQTEDQLDIVAETSGRFPVELRSARGTTAFDLEWVGPTEELLAAVVPGILSQPRTAAGVVRLANVSEALLVQHAVTRHRVDDLDAAVEALDLFTARRAGTDLAGPLEVAYLCREYDRLGEVELLDEATAFVLAQREPSPGLGLAATQLCLSLIVSGRGVADVLEQLSDLVGQLPEIRDHGTRPGATVADVSAQTAALELIAVTDAGPGAGGDIRRAGDVVPRIAALGLHLGAGLKGRPVRPLPVAELSHLITVLELLPDGLSSQLSRSWGRSAHALARAATPELLARLAGEPVGEAHAWLVLGLQST